MIDFVVNGIELIKEIKHIIGQRFDIGYLAVTLLFQKELLIF